MDLPNFESIPAAMPNEGQATGISSQMQEVQRNAVERNFKRPENEPKDKTTVPVPGNLPDADSASVSQNTAATSPKVEKAKARKIPRKTKLANKEQEIMKNEVPVKEKVKRPRKISLKKMALTQKEKGKTLTDLTKVGEDIERAVGSDSEPENDAQLTVPETESPSSHPLTSKRSKRARVKKAPANGASPKKLVKIRGRKKSDDAKSTKKRTIPPEKQGAKRRKHSGEPSKKFTDVTDEISDGRSESKSSSKGKDSNAIQRHSRSLSPPVASRKSRTSPTRQAGKRVSARASSPKNPPATRIQNISEEGGNVKGGGSRKRASRSLKVEGTSVGSRHNSRIQPSANGDSAVRSSSGNIKMSSGEDSKEMHDSISQNAEVLKSTSARSPKRRRSSSNGTLNEQPKHSRKMMQPGVAATEKRHSKSNSKHIHRSVDKHYKLSYGQSRKPMRLGGTQRKQLKAPSRKRGQQKQQTNRRSSKGATRRRSQSQKQARRAKSQQSQKKRMQRRKRNSATQQTRQKSSVAKSRRKPAGRRSVGRYKNE